MKLRYLFVDELGQLRRVRRRQIEALWRGEISARDLGHTGLSEIRVISVLCDRRLLPRRVFLLRLPLCEGRFTKANYLTLQAFTMPDCVTPQEVVQHHTKGWPADFYLQMAVALDVSRKQLEVPVGIGGPLFMAAAMKVTPKQALRYLR